MEILANETTLLPEGDLNNGRLSALTISSKSSLHCKVVALEMSIVPESDLNVNST